MDTQRLTLREQQVLDACASISADQNSPASTQQIADAVGITRLNTYQVVARLVDKGYLTRGRRGICVQTQPTQRLEGTSKGTLTLTIELTGHPQRVIRDAQAAIDRLKWFKEQLSESANSKVGA